jgi:hypothetical protein
MSLSIENCNFVGATYDAKAVDAITLIAKALQTNADALLHLSKVLSGSQISIESMIKVMPEPIITAKKLKHR